MRWRAGVAAEAGLDGAAQAAALAQGQYGHREPPVSVHRWTEDGYLEVLVAEHCAARIP